METLDEKGLSALLTGEASLRLIEPHIYSVLSGSDAANDYDTSFGAVYEWVACNSLYNRLIWGYSVSIFAALAQEALRSAGSGVLLDLGCGSLAFTAHTYLHHSERPVVLVDQSLRMLRRAKSRLIRLHGAVPGNMIFLHADAMRLPFREHAFTTILSENLLHCLGDTETLFARVKGLLVAGGRFYGTTLVTGNRFGDRYLETLAKGGKLVPRGIDDHIATLARVGMAISHEVHGNMATMRYAG